MDYDTSILAKLLGQNWRTTLGGTLAAAGGILASQGSGKWQIVGSIMLAIGLQWMGVTARDKGVTAAQMDAAKADKTDVPPSINPRQPPTALLLLIVACAVSASVLVGCLAPVTVNVFSSRLIVAPCSTNSITQSIEGGAILASNTTTATVPLK